MREGAGLNHRGRRVAVLTLVAVAAVAATTPAVSLGASARVSATPSTVRFGHVQTISGHQWAVNEFCRRTVRLTLRSAQNSVGIGTARVRDNGTFTRHWTPRRATVGAGAWTLVVSLRCESGKDGSNVFVRRTVSVRIH